LTSDPLSPTMLAYLFCQETRLETETPLKRPKVIIIAQNQPLDNDAHLRRKLADTEKRALRQSSRFPRMDLPGIQKGVHENLKKPLLFWNGRYMDLLDLMNFVRGGRRLPTITPENVTQHYSLANTVTLNGIYLYQFLRDHGYDPIIVQNYATARLPELLAEHPTAVCISSNFIFMNDIHEMASVIKQQAPQVPIIAGGMLVKKVLNAGEQFSRKTLDFMGGFNGCVDAFVIEAQGEVTLVKLLAALRRKQPLDSVPNLAYFNADRRMVFTHRQAEDIHMDQTAISWDRIPKIYLRDVLPVNSSRGCFYRCRFCTYHWLFPEVHYKSLDVLRQELREIRQLGFVTHVRFTDDNFTASKVRMRAVLEMIVAEGFDYTWSSFARASALTPELVKLMKRSGCEFVDLGLESGSQTILDNMDKRLSRKQSL